MVVVPPLSPPALASALSSAEEMAVVDALVGEGGDALDAAMREAIRSAIRGGMPTLAECGGFMYLHEQMEDMDGRFWPMVDVIPGKAYRTPKLGRFGYITLSPNADTAYLPAGETVRAHEFHYFESENCGSALTAVKPDGKRQWTCEHADGALLAGFPHLYYESNPDLIVRFLRKCAERR